MFSEVALPFCIPTISEWQFLLPHILTNIWCFHVSDFGSGWLSSKESAYQSRETQEMQFLSLGQEDLLE